MRAPITLLAVLLMFVASVAQADDSKGAPPKKDQKGKQNQKQSMVGTITRINPKAQRVVVTQQTAGQQIQTQQKQKQDDAKQDQKKPKQMVFVVDDQTVITDSVAQKTGKVDPDQSNLGKLAVGQSVRVVYVVVRPDADGSQKARPKGLTIQDDSGKPDQKVKPGQDDKPDQKVKPGQDDTPDQKVKPGQDDTPGKQDQKTKPGKQDQKKPRRMLHAVSIQILSTGPAPGQQDGDQKK